MLTDSQIERYSRQIVLPEVGGHGQERLLAASVVVSGGGSAAIFCAAHLAAAGVGKLGIDGIDANAPLASALAVRARNVDCDIDVPPLLWEADLTILLGEVNASSDAMSHTLLWGRESTEGIVVARFPTGRGCIPCLSALASRIAAAERFGQLLGALLATLGLRALLGIGIRDRAELLRLAPDVSSLVPSPFPSRPECPACS